MRISNGIERVFLIAASTNISYPMSRTIAGHRLTCEVEQNSTRSPKMKYMLLMSAPKEAFEWYSKWPKADLQANMAFMRNLSKELKEEGIMIATEGLAWPDQAVIVHAGKDGEPITD